MMDKSLKYVLAAALVVCSCVENKSWDEDSSVSAGDGEKTFNLLASPYTRAAVSQEDYSVEWTSGDRISILDGVQNREFITSEGGALAKFSGTASAAGTYYAVYPYSDAVSLTDDILSVNFPAQQTEMTGDIPNPMASVWVGKSRGTLILMNNLCATLAFSFQEEDVRSVTISGNSSEKLSGTVYMTFEDDTPSVADSQLTGESVTLLPSDGEFFAAGTHAFTLLPGDFPDGMTLTFVRADGQDPVVKKINTVKSLSASSVVSLGSLDLNAPELRSVSVGESVPSGSGAVLNGSMEVVRFKADRVACGFEYRFTAQEDWTSVTCATSAETFSYSLKGLKHSAEPVTYRSWAMVDGYKICSEEEKTFTMLPPYVMTVSFIDSQEPRNIGALLVQWEFKTQRKMPPADYNNKEYIYTTPDNNTFSFRFWCRPDHEGFCIRAITQNKNLPKEQQYYTYHGICLNYSSTSEDGFASWALLPSLEGARLISADIQMYDRKSVMTLSSSIGEDGTPSADSIIATATSEDKNYGYMHFDLPESEIGKQYYLSTVKSRMTITGMTLTFQYE